MNPVIALRNLKCTAARRASQGMAGPLQEAQRSRCALQVTPFGAYRLIHTLCYKFSPGLDMLSNLRLDCESACKPE